MDYRDIISMLDAEIGRLEEAGRLLKQGGKVDAAIKAVTTRQQKADAMPKKRVLSPEARARIAEAQRKRWAASTKAAEKAAKNASPVKAKKAAPKKAVKRTLSPEARQRIADAQRKRWAAAKKLESAAHPKATKKAPKKVAPRKAAKVLQQWRCRKARSRRLRLSIRVQTRPSARSFYDGPMYVLQLIHPRRNPVPLRSLSELGPSDRSFEFSYGHR